MKKNLQKGLLPALFLLLTLILSACGAAAPTEDPVLKITQVASTIMAEMTQSAALTPSATPTLEPTATATKAPPTPTVSDATSTPTAKPVVEDALADDAIYIEDVTYPDGTIVKPGSKIIKIWKVKNTGQNTWKTAYRLAYLEGLQDAPGLLYIHLPYGIRPNEMMELPVEFNVPLGEGTVTSYWRLVNYEGQPFGQVLSMSIYVGNP